MIKFEKISKYKDCADLAYPVRKTEASAGYDFTVAEDIVIPSYHNLMKNLSDYGKGFLFSLDEVAILTKKNYAKPTLVPTGMKCYLEPNTYLELSVRSSCPLKYWLVLAIGVGIIDADYCDNPDNEGHIYFQIINLAPFDILLKKGDIIGQGIIKPYLTTDNDTATGKRLGGFGSTTTK